jgi:hypothetical protein
MQSLRSLRAGYSRADYLQDRSRRAYRGGQ